MTNAEAVARVLNSLKLNTKDSHISRRFVLRTLRTIAKTYISQRLLDRTLQFDYNLYTILECFEFVEDDVVSCPFLEFRRCNKLMRSKYPLPSLIHSRLGASVKEVRSVDDGTLFSLIDRSQYERNNKRKYKLDEINVFVSPDGYLYIPEKHLLAANVEILTMETDMVDDLCGCGKKKNCKSGWEYEFICPDKLEFDVFTKATQIIAGTFGATIKDSNPNGIDKQPTA